MSEKTTMGSLSGQLSSFFEGSPREKIALGGILLLSAFLTLYRLPGEGYGNVYYAAAVKNMLRSWNNFFFVSFDAGFVTVDKPPLGLWIQAISAWVFGFQGWSLILPQAIACVLSVALLYHLVTRTFGSRAGLIAALTMALTPVVIPTSRNNTTDMLVVLAVLAGAYFVLRATETGRRRWLFGSVIAVGLGFNIKMMQAFLVLPAFYLVYLLGTEISVRQRIIDLVLATGVLSVVSFSWAIVVSLTPASQRPFIGSTDTNSIFSLIFGYNGIQRLLGMGGGAMGGSSSGGMGFSHGAAGPLRLLNGQLAGQISWLLPIALVTLVVLVYRHRNQWPLNKRGHSVVLWGMWFLTAAAFFSVAGFFHLYYLVMLAPAVAALVGIGLVELWSEYWKPGLQGWLLPATLIVTAAVQADILMSYPTFGDTLIPIVVGGTVLAAVVLVVGRVRQPTSRTSRVVMATAVGVGIVALLVTPTIWGAFSITSGTNVLIPSAGPSMMEGVGGGGMPTGGGPSAQFDDGAPQFNNSSGQASNVSEMPAGGMPTGGMSGMSVGTTNSETNEALISYLEAHQGNATYLAAADGSATVSAPLMLETDEPIISLGGFSGSDPVMDASELASLINSGELHYILVSSGPMGNLPAEMNNSSGNQSSMNLPNNSENANFGSMFGGNQQSETTQWVKNNCTTVPSDQWQSSNSSQSESTGYTLYNCTAAVSS